MIEPQLKLHPRFNILVSYCGTIIKNPITGHIYKPNKSSKGYMRVEFRHLHNGITKVEKELVHRLVLETYVPKVKGKNEGDHIDRVRDHNHGDNLRWANRKEQVKNSAAYKHGKYKKKRK